jgi:2-methylisocitrate lyase-like PEP mutase family enzyme
MIINLLEYIGIALIIFGGCLYFLSVYMIKKYEDKLRKEYTFEIVRPKIKTKSNRLDTKK